MGTVHLAGNDVRIGTRIIQRCLICGFKLLDMDLSRMAVPDGDDRGVATFAVGHLIEVSEGNPTNYVDIGDTKQPQFDAGWQDCCIHLVE